jgi:hypothetical protein
VVFCYSLKDERPIAPQMSCGSRAGHTRPIALHILIRATQPDIALRCCWAPLPVRNSAAETFFAKLPITVTVPCATTEMQSMIFRAGNTARRRCERFGY